MARLVDYVHELFESSVLVSWTFSGETETSGFFKISSFDDRKSYGLTKMRMRENGDR